MVFDFDMVVYMLGLAATAGTILARISALERKVERHNGLIERVYRLEERNADAERRLERMEKEEQR